jgi:hypothetical protein
MMNQVYQALQDENASDDDDDDDDDEAGLPPGLLGGGMHLSDDDDEPNVPAHFLQRFTLAMGCPRGRSS